MQETLETPIRSLAREDPLEKSEATHSSILAWRIPWTEVWRVTVHEAAENQTHCCWNPPSMRLCKLILVTAPGREGKERAAGRKDRTGWGGRRGPQKRKKGKRASLSTHVSRAVQQAGGDKDGNQGRPWETRGLAARDVSLSLTVQNDKATLLSGWMSSLSTSVLRSHLRREMIFLNPWTSLAQWWVSEASRQEVTFRGVFCPQDTSLSPTSVHLLIGLQMSRQIIFQRAFLSPPVILSQGSSSSLVTLWACVVAINSHIERLEEALSLRRIRDGCDSKGFKEK